MTTPAGEAPDNTKRNILIGGAVVIIAGIAVFLATHGGSRGGETRIVVGDGGSIRLESESVDWSKYKKYPNDAQALVLVSQKADGRIYSVSDGTTTVQCTNADKCVVVVTYRNSSGHTAAVAARSGKNGNTGKGLVLVMTIPLSEFDLESSKVLKSKDASYKATEGMVWMESQKPTPLCQGQDPCKITLDYK